MDLRTVVAGELSAWVAPDEVEAETERAVHRLESGERRAVLRTREGEMRLLLSEGRLLIELPNGAKKVRDVGGG